MKHSLLQRILAGLIGLHIFSACVTRKNTHSLRGVGKTEQTRITPPEKSTVSDPKRAPSSALELPITDPKLPPSSSTELPASAFVTQFEMALGKRDCETIRSLQKRLISPPESYANSVLLATLWCAQQKQPNDKVLLQRLTAAIDQSIKNEAPLFDNSYLELLRAEALASAGEAQSSRHAFAKALSVSALQFMNMVSGQTLRSELQGLEPILSGAQMALLRDVRSSLADPMTQAAALTKFDELLSQTVTGPLQDKLKAIRLKLFSAFELAFASQLATLEELRMNGDAVTTEEMVKKLRQMFPSRPHQNRIDALVGTTQTNKPQSTDTTSNQCTPVTVANTAPSDKSDMTAERALQFARAALNDGKPEEAVETLDNLADAQKTNATRRLRREASESHIRDLRRKASELYQRGTNSADSQAKLDSFAQCKQILENLLSRYPEMEASKRSTIQRSLNSVSENIQELRKVQAK